MDDDFNLSIGFYIIKNNTIIYKEENQIISREELSAMANLGFDEGVSKMKTELFKI